ncbi:LuxR C-terminal-related transcriptional regulator [Intrasporangium sp. DVR]|uniref:LuxR C-terminal-related transcriptional regulator n=1 Tax=Intrasporangium sp. DVR TaxID=3127867 RepID=UPI00333FA671
MSETSHDRPDLAAAREAFARGDWLTARAGFLAARETTGLEPADLEQLSTAAWFLGDGPESLADSELLFERLATDGATTDAADLALRLALEWALNGEMTVASGWLVRADRLLEGGPAHPAKGYAAYCRAGLSLDVGGDPGPAQAAAEEVTRIAEAFRDPALGCLGKVLRAMAAIRSGRALDGFNELDEAMLSVLAGRVHPLWAGDVYCSVIHLCEQLGDLQRMRAWTDALERWATPLSRTFVYAGVTRVHQLQLISAEGGWDVVEAELGPRSDALGRSHVWVAGAGYTELGDIKRLRGDLDGARAAYDRASALGVDPQPGHSLLLRARGQAHEALSQLRASLSQRDRLGRAKLLLAGVEVALELGDAAAAGQLATELVDTAGFYATPGLLARADHAQALVALANGRQREAAALLDSAARVYREQRYRYATATVHEHLALAHRALGQEALADAEQATALAIYRQLGAEPDARRLAPAARPGGLTEREVEVLACVASGASNRAVASRLRISEKTVSRHLANIYTKAAVNSRTAAAAWAREHGIVARRPD